MSRILLLGGDGMLGTALRYVLGRTHEITVLKRDDFDIESGAWRSLPVAGQDYVLNAAGIINKRQAAAEKFLIVNSVFPHALAGLCGENGARLIHFSTDCVFAGTSAPYYEDTLPDASDLYGRTKALGEPTSGLTIRTSIIGPEMKNGYNLMCWALSQGEIRGFTNIYWNGLTTLALAQAVGTIIESGMYVSGVRHLYSSDCSKCDLIGMICDAFGSTAPIAPVELAVPRDTRLGTRYPEFLTRLNVPPIGEQIATLATISDRFGRWHD